MCLVVSCQCCQDCQRGRPLRCQHKKLNNRRPRLREGDELTPILGAGGLAELALVDDQHVVAKPASLDIRLGALLGCGVATGYGAAVNTGGVVDGDSVAVIGCGGVGLSAIAGAKSAGAHIITAFDFQSDKLKLATEFGADVTVDGAESPVALGDSFDVVIDAVGGDGPLQQALALAR